MCAVPWNLLREDANRPSAVNAPCARLLTAAALRREARQRLEVDRVAHRARRVQGGTLLQDRAVFGIDGPAVSIRALPSATMRSASG